MPHQLVVEERDGPDGATTALDKLEREANKSESALSHQTFQVVQPFDVCNVPLATDVVREEVELALGGRRHGLDTKDLTPLVGQPVNRFGNQPWEVVLPPGIVA